MSPSASFSSSTTRPPVLNGAPTLSQAATSTDPAAAAAATRSLQEADALLPPATLSAPASQKSFASIHSGGRSVGVILETSSSNASQWTSRSELTSPTTNGVPNGHRLRTPDPGHLHSASRPQHNEEALLASPMPNSANGTKRTASGSVKGSAPNTPAIRRPRTESMSSTTSSRAGDLALSLKTRLEYAMAKVQHGWEHKNIHEVERLARNRASPDFRHSMSHVDYVRRPATAAAYAGNRFSALEVNGGFYVHDGPQAWQPSKRHSGTYGFVSSSSSQPILGSGPRLQPAADILPASSSQPLQQKQHLHYHKTASPNGYHANGTIMSPPRTPVNGTTSFSRTHRPPTIRTETQTAEAEREALQALTQLGSPHGSQMPTFQHGSSQGSPSRSEFATPRRVTFARSESDSSAGRFSASSQEGGDSAAQGLQSLVEV